MLAIGQRGYEQACIDYGITREKVKQLCGRICEDNYHTYVRTMLQLPIGNHMTSTTLETIYFCLGAEKK